MKTYYSKQQKEEAIARCQELGNIVSAAISLNIPHNTLYGWMRKHKKKA